MNADTTTPIDLAEQLESMLLPVDRSSGEDELALATAQSSAANLVIATQDADDRLESIREALATLFDAADAGGAHDLKRTINTAWEDAQHLHAHTRKLMEHHVALVALATRIWTGYQQLLTEHEDLTDALMTTDTDHPLIAPLYEGFAESAYHDVQATFRDERKRLTTTSYNEGYSDGVNEHQAPTDYTDRVADALGCGWAMAQRIVAGLSGDIALDDNTIEPLLNILYELQRQNGYA